MQGLDGSSLCTASTLRQALWQSLRERSASVRDHRLPVFASCRPRRWPGGAPGEWLCAKPGVDPNIDFVRALRDALSNDDGTIFRWSAHENTVLNKLREELLCVGCASPEQGRAGEFH